MGLFLQIQISNPKWVRSLYVQQEVFGPDCSSRIFLVDWKVFPKKIPATFNAVEGGHILLDDRAEVVSNILLEDEE